MDLQVNLSLSLSLSLCLKLVLVIASTVYFVFFYTPGQVKVLQFASIRTN